MTENHVQFPNKRLTVKNMVDEGDLVTVHLHIVASDNEKGVAAIHLVRSQDGKFVETWDCGQRVPNDSPNDGGVS